MSKFTRCGHDRIEWVDLNHFPLNILTPLFAIALGCLLGEMFR